MELDWFNERLSGVLILVTLRMKDAEPQRRLKSRSLFA